MIWKSVLLMTLIDALVILVTTASIYLLWQHRGKMAKTDNLWGLYLIAAGISVIGLFYLGDLITMFVLPIVTTQRDAMAAMEELHLNHSWIILPTGVLCIFTGFCFMHQRIFLLIDRLENSEATISKHNAQLHETNNRLQQSEERFQLAIRATTDGVWDWDILTNEVYLAPRWCEILGYSYDDPALLHTYESWVERIHSDDYNAVMNAINAHLNEGKVYDVDYRHRHQSGEYRWQNARGQAIFDENGKPIRMAGCIRDITERKQVEEVLRERERQLIESQQIAHIGSWEWDLTIDASILSDEFYHLFGLKVDGSSLSYEQFLTCIHPDDRETVKRQVGQSLATNQPYEGEYRVVHPDGTVLVIHSRAEVSSDATGKPIKLLGTVQDITERKRMEQELIRLERMSARSEMVSGINHNLNNLLQGVLGPAEMLQLNLDDRQNLPQNHQWVELIITAAERATTLVRRLSRAISGQGETLQVVDVHSVVQEAVQLTQPHWRDETQKRGIAIDVVTELEDVPPVGATPAELNDLLINLIYNAVEALPEGGTITLGTQAVEDHVQLTVRDTGIGMEEEVRRRVFEPFFTTKANVGSGVGLYTVYTTMSNWGGAIEVDSIPGEGATFTLQLPVWIQTPEAQVEDRVESTERPTKILLVEDDEMVIQTLVDYLPDAYEVDVVRDGQQAVEDFTFGRFDVALIDLGLPGLPGHQVAQQIRQVDPSLVAVLITGFELEAHDPHLAVFDLWYRKPLSLAQLDEMMEQVVSLHQSRTKGNR